MGSPGRVRHESSKSSARADQSFLFSQQGPSASLRISPAGSRYAHARTTAQLGVRGVGGSNLPVPTNLSSFHRRSFAFAQRFRLRAPATLTPALRLILGCAGTAVQISAPRPI